MAPRWAVGLAAALLAGGCAAAPPPPAEEPAPSEGAKRRPDSDGPEVKQAVGAMNEEAVTRVFGRLLPKIEKCQDDRRRDESRLDFLSGEVKIEVRVDESGAAKRVFLTRSTLGDRDVEKCITQAAQGQSWPKPVGGLEGVARSEFNLPMKGDRDAVAWEPKKVADAVSRARSALRQCGPGKGAGVEVTAYVGEGGKVIAAGASTPAEGSAQVADCLAGAARAMRMPSPGGWPAKVTFTVE